jgi:hypothetical protein
LSPCMPSTEINLFHGMAWFGIAYLMHLSSMPAHQTLLCKGVR